MKINYSLLAMFIIFFVSCNNSDVDEQQVIPPDTKPTGYVELSTEEIISIAYTNPKEIEEGEVINVIKEFQLAQDAEIGTKNFSSNTSIKVKDKYYIHSSDIKTKNSKSLLKNEIKTAIYNVEISQGTIQGKALVSADERYPVVLSYTPKTNDENNVNRKLMEDYSHLVVLDVLNYYEHLKDSLYEQTICKIAEKLSIPTKDLTFDKIKDNIKIKGYPSTKGYSYLPTKVVSYVGPLTRTDWDQDGVYNQKLLTNNKCSEPYYPAGCGVVAGAIILAHFEPTMKVTGANNAKIDINWSYLKQNRCIYTSDPVVKKDMVGYLFKDVFDGSKATPGCDGTSTNTSNVENYLRKYINIDSYIPFNVSACKQSLDNLRLCMAGGVRNKGTQEQGSHAWVVDGYAVCERLSREIVKRYDLYLHCNMGWSGFESGYFLVNQDLSITFPLEWGNRIYNSDLKCSPNARKK